MFISLLVCSLAGQKQTIRLTPGSVAHKIYGREVAEVEEQFYCNYGLNPQYRSELESGEMKVTGIGPDGEARVIEMPDNRFFIGTLFVPQLSSTVEKPHQLIIAYLKAALKFQTERLNQRTD